jgi:hypothetical protein
VDSLNVATAAALAFYAARAPESGGPAGAHPVGPTGLTVTAVVAAMIGALDVILTGARSQPVRQRGRALRTRTVRTS